MRKAVAVGMAVVLASGAAASAAVPYLVKDIRSTVAVGSANPASFVALPGATLFAACDAFLGCELWRTDGTFLATTLVKDISPGAGGSNPRFLTRVGSAVFFSADDGMGGAELWKSDGTSTGTVRVKDIATGSATSGCGRWIRHFRPRRDDAHERLLLPRSGAELLRIGDFRDCQLRRDPGGPILSVTAA